MEIIDSTSQSYKYFDRLHTDTQQFISQKRKQLRLSFQESRQLGEMALDLQLWGGPTLIELWSSLESDQLLDKQAIKRHMSQLRQVFELQKNAANHYPQSDPLQRIGASADPCAVDKPKLGLGRCPVASPRTLCCNLQTLDAVDNCGYGCSYCSIQSFFDGKEIRFDRGFAEKLKQLQLDPQQTYHIGTGQSSDSLMWGNSHGVLDALIEFATTHPNVILELKTKSANVSHLLKSAAPKNMLCTWSLNTQKIITHEEHGTASFEKRIAAARKTAEAGFVVGFHFHPMVYYQGWEEDYSACVDTLVAEFDPHQVALVSIGTLTWIKPVLNEIRNRAVTTQIHKMPMVEADGKWSYPDEIKQQLFKLLYERFPQSWKEQVFYYLCMENQRHWKPVLGFDYADNTALETAMKNAYRAKIERAQAYSDA